MISTVDTHELVKELKASGFSDARAEAVTRAVRQSQDFSDLATKSDLALMRSELHAELGEVRSELRAEIGTLRAEIGEVRGDLRVEIGEVRGELRTEAGSIRGTMVAMELRLIKWMIGIGIAAALAVGGMIWTAAQFILRAPPHV
jgi:hypothetical protein